MAETNQLLLNYYKKEEIKKIKKLSKEKASLKTILSMVDLTYITKDEVLEILGEDYEQEIEDIEDIKDITENDFNTSSVIENTPMGKAKKYKKCFEQYNKNRVLVCKEKNIGNGTLQRYLRLNYLIPELQDLVNKKKLGVNLAEHIRFIGDKNLK